MHFSSLLLLVSSCLLAPGVAPLPQGGWGAGRSYLDNTEHTTPQANNKGYQVPKGPPPSTPPPTTLPTPPPCPYASRPAPLALSGSPPGMASPPKGYQRPDCPPPTTTTPRTTTTRRTTTTTTTTTTTFQPPCRPTTTTPRPCPYITTTLPPCPLPPATRPPPLPLRSTTEHTKGYARPEGPRNNINNNNNNNMYSRNSRVSTREAAVSEAGGQEYPQGGQEYPQPSGLAQLRSQSQGRLRLYGGFQRRGDTAQVASYQPYSRLNTRAAASSNQLPTQYPRNGQQQLQQLLAVGPREDQQQPSAVDPREEQHQLSFFDPRDGQQQQLAVDRHIQRQRSSAAAVHNFQPLGEGDFTRYEDGTYSAYGDGGDADSQTNSDDTEELWTEYLDNFTQEDLTVALQRMLQEPGRYSMSREDYNMLSGMLHSLEKEGDGDGELVPLVSPPEEVVLADPSARTFSAPASG